MTEERGGVGGGGGGGGKVTTRTGIGTRQPVDPEPSGLTTRPRRFLQSCHVLCVSWSLVVVVFCGFRARWLLLCFAKRTVFVTAINHVLSVSS